MSVRFFIYVLLFCTQPVYAESTTTPGASPLSSIIVDHKKSEEKIPINLDVAITDDLDQHPLATQIRLMNEQSFLVQHIKTQGIQGSGGSVKMPTKPPGFLDKMGHAYGLPHNDTQGKIPKEQSPALYTDSLRLTFTTQTLPGMALIKIYDAYWLFFDKNYTMDAPTRLPYGIQNIYDYSTPFNTIFKIVLAPDFWPHIRVQTRTIHAKNKASNTHATKKESPTYQEFILECTQTPLVQRQQQVITWPNTLGGAVKILLPLYTKEVPWYHPELKQTFMIYLSKRHEGTFTPQEHYPHFSIYASYLGLALHPHSDSLVMVKDGEDLNLHDARGLSGNEEVFTYPPDTLFFYDPRPPQAILAEFQTLQDTSKTPKLMLREVQLALSLGFFSEASLTLKKLIDMNIPQYQRHIDFMLTALLTLSAGNELSDLPNDYVHHAPQSLEFAFWHNLYHKRPQNYAHLVTPVLSNYPLFLRNKIAEILLTLPDSYDNLRRLIQVPGLHHDLVERARLKLALMPPIDLRELDDLKEHSLQRDVQARAAFQLILEQKKEWRYFKNLGREDETRKIKDQKQAITDLEKYLLSFGPDMFQAKMLLAQLYKEQKNYIQAMHLLRDTRQSDPDRFEDVQRAMQRVYDFFFYDLGTPHLLEAMKKNVCPITPMPRMLHTQEHPARITPHALSVLGFYNDFKEFTPSGPSGLPYLEHVAARLFDLALYDEALELLNKRLESLLESQGVREGHTAMDGRDLTRLRTMIVMLSLIKGDTEVARKHIDIMTQNDEGMSQQDLEDFVHCLHVTLLEDAHDQHQALTLLMERTDVQSLTLRAHIYWQQKDWKNLQRLIPYMLDHTNIKKDDRPRLIMHLAIARIMDPLAPSDVGADSEPDSFEAQLARQSPLQEHDLRRLYGREMEKSAFNPSFQALTTPDLAVHDGLRYFETLKPILDQGWMKGAVEEGSSSAVKE